MDWIDVNGRAARSRHTHQEVHDLIDRWHDLNGAGVALWEFLGWTDSQYWDWVIGGVLPQDPAPKPAPKSRRSRGVL